MTAAECLRLRKSDILSLWERLVRAELRGAATRQHAVLINSLPLVIDELVKELSGQRPRLSAVRGAGLSHATQRAAIDSYSLDQVQSEYTLLRRAIFEVLEREVLVGARERNIVLDFLASIRLATTREFMRLSHVRIAESEERLALALEAARMGIFDLDLRNNKLRWSETLKSLWGYRQGEFDETIEAFWARLHADDRAQVGRAFQAALAHRDSFYAECRVVWPDQSVHWIEANGRVYRDEDCRPYRMTGTAMDITGRKRIESDLRLSEAKFRRIYESNMVGLAFANFSGDVFEANDYMLSLMGFTPQDLKEGRINWIRLTPPEYLTHDQRAFVEMKARGTCKPFEQPLIRKDGRQVWVMVTAAFVDDRQSRYIALMIDITERRRISEALLDSERKMRLINNLIPQVIWTVTPDGVPGHFNQNWYRYTGFSPDKPWNVRWDEIVHPEDIDEVAQRWREVQRTGEPFSAEFRFKRFDGTYRWFLARAEPMRDATGKIVEWFGTSTEIDDQKRALQLSEEEQRLREQFVSMLSHDLRNPLSAAMATAQIIARMPGDPERVGGLAQRIFEDLGRANKMIQDLLDVNRIRAGKPLPVQIERCDLVRIAERACSDLSAIHGDRFKLRMPRSLEGYWSARDLHRLLDNLLVNAVKYGRTDTPVEVALRDDGTTVEISVHNEGKSISPEDLARLFKPFVRTGSAQGGKSQGWGIGLTVVRGVAQAHAGRVEVESAPGAGTTFRVTLPKDARGCQS
jgi:PAS domain S-box-containing protein